MRILIILHFFCVVLFSCKNINHRPLVESNIGNDTIYTCDISKISKKEKIIKLSELIDSFQIVHFENSDTALFKDWKVYITEHYIGILQDGMFPFKLFDHNGNFICNIGNIGQANGEYTRLYSCTIDENNSSIWLAPFNGNHLIKYNMNGKCIFDIKTRNMQKPIIRHEKDGTLTVANLFFKNRLSFLYLRLLKNDSLRYLDTEKEYAFNAYDKEGRMSGFNHEIWFYNNTEHFTYMNTLSNQLYKYNISTEQTTKRLSITSYLNDNTFLILDELPSFFLIKLNSFNGKENKVVFAEKETGKTYYVKILNDFIANLPVLNFTPRNGWYYEMYEPIELIDLITQHLMNENLNKMDKMKLENLLSKIDEESNNILFMGKLSFP